MTEADVEAVSDIRVRGWQTAYAGMVPRSFLDGMTVEDDARRRRAWFRDPRRRGFDLVADAGAGPVGWVSCGPYREAGAESRMSEAYGPAVRAGEVYALYVRPDLIGHGVGRALLDAVHDRAGAEGFGLVALWVLSGNRTARRFYERSGYALDGGEQRDAYGDVVLTELRYGRSL
ncbi:GNAT family N-acetyltransferase [Streptomyces sp. NPDC048416]|uniref:GNAT family N-acetyltransferase n=1 Tax=Streptomyces sp. NPDC048416 TaxID=3365546 RepID=UPI0037154FE3